MSDVPSVPSAASEPVEPAPASSPKARRVKVVKNDAVLAADAARDMARAAVVEIGHALGGVDHRRAHAGDAAQQRLDQGGQADPRIAEQPPGELGVHQRCGLKASSRRDGRS